MHRPFVRSSDPRRHAGGSGRAARTAVRDRACAVGFAIVVFGIGACLAEAAHAQATDSIRVFAGAELMLASPTGEFAENVGKGGGIAGHAAVALTPAGGVALRLDLGFINYGNETIAICIVSCRVTGDLTTSNNIVFAGVGPELSVGGEAFRLHGNGTVGFAYFGTTSSVEGAHQDGNPFASSTNFDDVTFAWTAGGGGRFRVHRGRSSVWLNLGVRYHGNGEARYLRKGDIVDRPDGSVEINPRRSDTNLWTFHLGVSVGMPSETGIGGIR